MITKEYIVLGKIMSSGKMKKKLFYEVFSANIRNERNQRSDQLFAVVWKNFQNKKKIRVLNEVWNYQ